MKFYIISFISILTLVPTAYANNASTSNIKDTWEGPVKLNLNIYAFAADVDGTLSKGNLDYKVDQPFKDTLENLDRSYMLHLDLNKGRWGAYLDTQMVKTSDATQVLNIPIAVATQLEQNSFGLYYQAYRSEDSGSKHNNNANNPTARFIVEPTIGMRRTEVNANLSAFNHDSSTSSAWNEFFWGSRFKYNFDSPWNLAAEVTFGSEDTRATQAYVGYRQAIFGRPVNFRMGYRYFEQDHRTDNFHWDIKQHGPVIGINLPIF